MDKRSAQIHSASKIIFPTGNIVYFYHASGQKAQKVVTENTTVTTTDYLGGYQYKNAVLQFFPTAEGYVKNTPVSGINTYSYVFNYTDHLGNTRLSYAKDTTTGSLKILEENNYYPFGLKHNSYNVDNFQPEYKYKFQGQERQDELGLNWDSFKYRNYDYVIGRFMSIDPLAEKYSYNSTYAFQENKMGLGRELEGLELIGWDSLRMIAAAYVTAKVGQFKANTSQARNDLKNAVGNRVQSSISGEKNNVNVAGYNVNAVSDYSTISKSVGKITSEAIKTSKDVVKDGAEVISKTGDALIVAAPLTGPIAPAVAGVGETMSLTGSATSILIDVSNGDIKKAGISAAGEIISGGLSTAIKNAPGVDAASKQIMDAHIVIYKDVIAPKIEEKK